MPPPLYRVTINRYEKYLLLAICFQVHLSLFAQCDTFPVQREWWGVDSDRGIAVMDFINPNSDGSPTFYQVPPDSVNIARVSYNTPGVAFAYSALVGSQGQVLLNLTGNGLRDSTYKIAQGTDSLQLLNRSFPLLRGFTTGSDAQPLLLPDPASPDPARPEQVYLFYTEMGSAPDLSDQDSLARLRARYLSIYDFFTGQLTVLDSVFTRGLTSATAAVRHPSGDGYWVLMSSHYPLTRLLAYRFSSNGLDPTPVVSVGGGEGPLPWGVPPATFIEDLNNFQEYIYPSPQGNQLARVRGCYGGPSSFDTPTTIELWDFNAATGQASFRRDIFRNISGLGGASWSQKGDYFYAEQGATDAGRNARIDSAFVVRRRIEDPTLLTANPLFAPPGDTLCGFFARCNHPMGMGPNGRLYFSACGVLEVQNTDEPHLDTATVYVDPRNRRAPIINYPNQPVLDFPSMRRPRLRLLAGANELPCARQTEVVIPRTPYLNPNDVQLVFGPGIDSIGTRRVGMRGDTLTLSLAAAVHASGRTFVVAHHLHPCKTYSDTLHLFAQAPLAVLDTVRICAGDSILLSGQWRQASFTSDTSSYFGMQASVLRPGCDSTSQVALISLPHDSLFNTAIVMPGDTLSAVVIGRRDTSFAVTLSGVAANGCDLIIKYDVEVDTTSSIYNVPQRRGANATLLELSAVNPLLRSEGLRAWVQAETGSASYRAASAGGGCVWTVVGTDGRIHWRGTTNEPRLSLPAAQDWPAGMYMVKFSSRNGRSHGQTKVVLGR